MKGFLISVLMILGVLGLNLVKTEVEAEATFNLSAIEFADQMGVGWNLGNSLDAYINGIPSETAWGNPVVTQDFIQAIKEAGFTTVRIPVSYMNYIDDRNHYQINEAWLNRVQEVVDWVVDAGMYAIINIHHDGNNDYWGGAWLSIEEFPYENPNWQWSGLDLQLNQHEIQRKFGAVWTQIATRFKDYNERLIFESGNELRELWNYGDPVGRSSMPNLNRLNQLFVDTVRTTGGHNSQRYLLISGYNTNLWITSSDHLGFQMPRDTVNDRLMLSIHYYDPWDFSLNEENDDVFKWGDEIHQIGAPHVDSWGHESYVRDALNELNTKFISRGVPVIMGEYGSVDKSHVDPIAHEYRRYYLEYVTRAMVETGGIVPVYWDNGWAGDYGFALFNRHTGAQIHEDLVTAIVRAPQHRVRPLFSRQLFEETFARYANNSPAVRTAYEQALIAADRYRNHVSRENLVTVETAYRNLVTLIRS